jgi:hypothetical protein
MLASPQTLTAAKLQSEWAAVQRSAPRHQPILRRPTPLQGRALEVLGHAVEYLVDSRLQPGSEASLHSDELAVQLLMRLNREVFAECAPVVPFGRRLHLLLRRWLRW